MKQINLSGIEAREKLLRGAEFVGDIVGSTIGPAGRNVVIEQKYRAPMVTNDGVTIARHISLNDPIEDLGAQVVVEAALKTNETAGDGTTTACVLTTSTLRTAQDRLNESGDPTLNGGSTCTPMSIFNNIISEGKKAVALVEKKAKRLKKGELIKVTTTSLENPEYAKMVADIVDKLGKDAHVSVTDNWATKYNIEHEVITGFRDYGTYASPYLQTNNKKEAIWEDTHVLVCNHEIQNHTLLKNLLNEMRQKGVMKLVIFSSGDGKAAFDDSLVTALVKTNIEAKKGNADAFRILPVKVPSMTSEQLTDLASFCNAKFFDHKLGEQLDQAQMVHLGFAERIVVNEDEFVVIGGTGDVSERVKTLQEQADTEKDLMFKEKMKRRIGALSSGIGIIRVGASTEMEREYWRLKFEDAVNAAKAALEEGIVKGGGLTLKEIAEELGPDSILYKPLQAPYEKIKENAGGHIDIGEDVVDPAKVERCAITNACSAAAALITADSAIAYEEPSVWNEMAKKMGAFIDTSDSDFRDSRNQDRGAGRAVK